MNLPQIMLAAPASGSGKTTAACALLTALRRRGLAPCAFNAVGWPPAPSSAGPTTSTPCSTGPRWGWTAATWICF